MFSDINISYILRKFNEKLGINLEKQKDEIRFFTENGIELKEIDLKYLCDQTVIYMALNDDYDHNI